MRKSNQEITDQAIIEQLLASETVCRIGMVDAGEPYVLPFNYGYEAPFLYIHAAPEGRKLDILRRNPRVCFEIEHGVRIIEHERACGWSTRYRSIVGYGTVDILTAEEDKRHGLAVLMAQHGAGELVDFDEHSMARMVILRLRIETLSAKQSSRWVEGEV